VNCVKIMDNATYVILVTSVLMCNLKTLTLLAGTCFTEVVIKPRLDLNNLL